MSWKVRHEGSPKSIDGLTVAQVVEGLQEGMWEPTDEVMGPNEENWTALENHPQFTEVVADLEPPIPAAHEDETRLDMNPLIDVCLVLLVFFILTTTYAALQKYLESPAVTQDKEKGLPIYKKEILQQFTVKVVARMEGENPVILVEDQPVPPEQLVTALRAWIKSERKTAVWLDIADDVPYWVEIKIRDAAKGAGLDKVLVQIDVLKKTPTK